MRKLILLLLVAACGYSQTTTEIEINPLIKGTLFSPPNQKAKTDLVIMIAGSGPTNRNGNQPGVQTNCTKYLAEGLAQQGISVFSFDKRIIAQMIAGINPEKDLRFSHQIDDVRDVMKYFQTKGEHRKIIIAGHSEGSLIGMVAASDGADAYISLAGAGRTIDLIITEQFTRQMPVLKDELIRSFAEVATGNTVQVKNPILNSIFRADLQPYLKSWIELDPQQEIKKLQIPVLIINGTKDYQVKETEAELLKSAKPDAELHLITNMNHLFKEIKGDDAENLASYNNPDLPVMPELISVMSQFIKKLKS